MDINFQPTTGDPFTIEIGYFDSVLEIKEKIQKYQGIPISKQVLSFEGKVLQDVLNVHHSDILDNSIIQLIIEDNIKKTAEDVTASRTIEGSIQVPKKKTILVKGLSSEQAIMVEIESDDRAIHLKQRIHEMFRIPTGQFALQTDGNLLNDNDELTNNLEIEATFAIPNKMTIHFKLPTAKKGNGNVKAEFFKSSQIPILVIIVCVEL